MLGFLLLIPLVVYLAIALLLVGCCYLVFRWACPKDAVKQSRTRVVMGSIAITGLAAVLLFLFFPPAYFATRIACSNSERKFTSTIRAHGEGISDSAGALQLENATSLLLSGRVSFVEMRKTSPWIQGHIADKAIVAPYVRLDIRQRDAPGCLVQYYHWLQQGLAPGECLAFSAANELSGRFELQLEEEVRWGARIVRIHLTDRNGAHPPNTILTASSYLSPNSLGGAMVQEATPRARAECSYDAQSVVHVFEPPAEPRKNSGIPEFMSSSPPPMAIVPLALVRSPIPKGEMRKRSLERSARTKAAGADIRLITKGSKAVVMKGDQYVGHLEL